MLRALLYMVKVGLLVGAAVWLADRPGTVQIDWMEYTFHIQLGFVLVMLMVAIMLAIFIYRAIHFIINLPRTYRKYRAMTDREKGHRALAIGLTAVAAGDARAAGMQAKRAVKFLPKDKGMPLLLLAQAERLKGNEAAAQKAFEQMLESKDTAFLGVRGLLKGALETKDYSKALSLAHKALELYPKQKWALRVVYDLEIRNRNWNNAKDLLPRAEKAGALSAEQSRSDRVAMLMIEAEDLQKIGMMKQGLTKLKQAYKLDPYFVPGAIALARRYKYEGQRRKAMKIVERTWAKTDHAVIARAWPEFMDTSKGTDPLVKLKWMEKLLSAHKDSAEAHLAIAAAAMDASLWGEARDHLQKAEDVTTDSRVFRLRSEIERRAFHDDSDALIWLKKAEEAPAPRAWVCRETGRIYPDWSPIAQPHGSFNTIIWDFPMAYMGAGLPDYTMGETLLEAPYLSRI